jgi:hypothetical protein
MNKDESDYWQCRRGKEVVAHGPKKTFPSKEERIMIRAGDLKIYVEGKLHREDRK